MADNYQDDNEVKTNVTKSTTKKRGAPKNDEEAIEPKKKRIITKTKKAVASTEDQDDDADAAADAELPPSPPVTPKKPRVKAAAANDANAVADTPKPKSNKKAKAAESSEDSADPATSQETTKTGTPRKRAATVKDKAVARGLPTCMEDASEADKMLLHMKDNEGKGWTAIRATWKAMTGQETAASTLPNRYNRLKSIMMVLKKGDVSPYDFTVLVLLSPCFFFDRLLSDLHSFPNYHRLPSPLLYHICFLLVSLTCLQSTKFFAFSSLPR